MPFSVDKPSQIVYRLGKHAAEGTDIMKTSFGVSDYTMERISRAVFLLATGKKTIKKRLMDASIEFCTIRKEELPEELYEDYQLIIKEVTKNKAKTIKRWPDGDEESTGTIGATVPFMRIEKAKMVAERIWYLNDRLQNWKDT